MELKTAIWTRRSVRNFKDTPIDHADIEEIMEGTLMAPSAINLQPWYFAVLEKRFPDHPEVVSETTSFLATCGGAPVVVLVFMNKPAFNELEKSSVNVQSVAAAIQNMTLLAWDKGISSCWTTAPLSAGVSETVEKMFAPDKGNFVAAVCLGYSDAQPKAPRRKTDRIAYL